MTERLVSLAGGKCVAALEGGYGLTATASAAAATLGAMLGYATPPLSLAPSTEAIDGGDAGEDHRGSQGEVAGVGERGAPAKVQIGARNDEGCREREKRGRVGELNRSVYYARDDTKKLPPPKS